MSAVGLQSTFCADAARSVGAPLYGSATQARVWLLLEYSGEWRSDAIGNNDLPAAVQAWLAAQVAAVPAGRAGFITQNRRQPDRAFFVAIATAERQDLYRFGWATADDLLTIDVAALLAGDLHGAARIEEPLVLVCTNGRHDPCCARYGTPAYQALAGRLEHNVWQTTHLGGHRYAGVGLVLPAGIQYGNLTNATADLIADALAENTIALEQYRGRTFYDGPINAADYFARRTCDLFAADALTLVAGNLISDGKWRIRFRDQFGQNHALVVLQLEGQPTLVSCAPNKWKPQPRFRLINHQIWTDDQHETS